MGYTFQRKKSEIVKIISGVNRSTTNILVVGELVQHLLLLKGIQKNMKYMKYLETKDDISQVKRMHSTMIQQNRGAKLLFTVAYEY